MPGNYEVSIKLMQFRQNKIRQNFTLYYYAHASSPINARFIYLVYEIGDGNKLPVTLDSEQF